MDRDKTLRLLWILVIVALFMGRDLAGEACAQSAPALGSHVFGDEGLHFHFLEKLVYVLMGFVVTVGVMGLLLTRHVAQWWLPNWDECTEIIHRFRQRQLGQAEAEIAKGILISAAIRLYIMFEAVKFFATAL